MTIFKCKMCGGSLEINNETIATCEYCRTQQTLPRLDTERRSQLYDRANHFRRNNEFDKAMTIYEQILSEDNTDAEAYWSLVLCRYGIEYVEEPGRTTRIPTVNRAQFTSVVADENYKSALLYATAEQKILYEAEAKYIDKVQKEILEISSKEEPFDVFICYKETDANGRRTQDSVLATDLYHQLTNEGFKVFFSRITLEDKLGTAYEPYIFAALNSAKVMVVLGTKPDYFNAVWVKNEWSRYLNLIRNGGNKILIPAYRDMDPYNLPEEFGHLQAQDMSKLGFMQDLIRGIKKIVGVENEPINYGGNISAMGNAPSATLLRRVFIFLEDGDWSSAKEYCEKILDYEPENAQAYLGKLMAELQVHFREDLERYGNDFSKNNNYHKIIRYGDAELVNYLKSCLEKIQVQLQEKGVEQKYANAIRMLNEARTEGDYRTAAVRFDELGDYRDSRDKMLLCDMRAKEAKQRILYDNACMKAEAALRVEEYQLAIEDFERIIDYRDSKAKIEYCRSQIRMIDRESNSNKVVTGLVIFFVTIFVMLVLFGVIF